MGFYLIPYPKLAQNRPWPKYVPVTRNRINWPCGGGFFSKAGLRTARTLARIMLFHALCPFRVVSHADEHSYSIKEPMILRAAHKAHRVTKSL